MQHADGPMPDQLRAPDGRVLASTEPDRVGLADTAMIRSLPRADPTEIAHAIVSGFSDWQISVDDERVADALVGLGGVLVRHAHVMSVDLTASDRITSAASAGSPVGVSALRNDPDRYAHLMTTAYPIGHVDHDPAELLPGGARHTVASYLSGAVVGPVRWDASCEAHAAHPAHAADSTEPDDEAIGFVVVSTATGGRVYPGGPWVTDIAVHPRLQGRGVGRTLLTHAMTALADAGDARLGLAVSHGNPARDLYARLGFVEILESWRFMIAGA